MKSRMMAWVVSAAMGLAVLAPGMAAAHERMEVAPAPIAMRRLEQRQMKQMKRERKLERKRMKLARRERRIERRERRTELRERGVELRDRR